MLNEATVEKVILGALETLNAELEPDRKVKLTPTMVLFGANAEIDSLSLVSVIVDVETNLNSDHGLAISLTDDRAMTREVSPFTDVPALKAYILELAAEQTR